MAERLKGKRVAQREQEDAQEFLGFLLDSMHEELIRLKNAYAPALSLVGERPSSHASSQLQKQTSMCLPREQGPRCNPTDTGAFLRTAEVAGFASSRLGVRTLGCSVGRGASGR